MERAGALRRRVRYALGRGRFDADLAEELESHRAMKQDELERSGMTRDEAIDASRRALGNVTLAREDARAVWIWPWLDSVWQDVTYAVRSLRRQPSFTVTAILTLGIGIGLNTSVTTLFTTLYWRQWSVRDPGQVVIVLKRTPRVVNYEFTYDQYRRIAGNARLMSVVATNCGESPREPDCVVRLGDVKESALFVSGNYFRALEIGTVLGRGFVDDDDRSAAPAAVAVISHRLWQRRFDADPAIVGKAIELDDKPFIVVGVVEPGFNGASIRRDIWLPLAAGQILRPTIRGMTWVELAGRLVPGASRAQAQAELQSLRVDSDKNTGRPVDILLVDTSVLSRPHVRAGGFLFFRVMFLGVVLVLLLACANDRKPAARAHADPRP